jgi:archaellum component FlaC
MAKSVFPFNNNQQLTPLYIMIGVIASVDTDRNVAVVNTSHGVFTDVRIPLPFYNIGGSGFFHTPAPGDIVSMALTSENEPFILNFYSYDPKAELDNKQRETPSPFSYVIKTKAGDRVQLSVNHEIPQIEISGKIVIDIITFSGKINIIGTTKDGQTTSGIEFDAASGICTFKVADGDGTPLVTQQQLQDVIDQLLTIIKTHKHPANMIPPDPSTIGNVTAVGVPGLQTQAANMSNVSVTDSLPESLTDDTDIKTDISNINSTLQQIQDQKNTIKTLKEQVDAAKTVVENAMSALEVAADYTKLIPDDKTKSILEGAKLSNLLKPSERLSPTEYQQILSNPTVGPVVLSIINIGDNIYNAAKTALALAIETYNNLMNLLTNALTELKNKYTELTNKVNILKSSIETKTKELEDKYNGI